LPISVGRWYFCAHGKRYGASGGAQVLYVMGQGAVIKRQFKVPAQHGQAAADLCRHLSLWILVRRPMGTVTYLGCLVHPHPAQEKNRRGAVERPV
jgi:hypothetical protein